MSAAGLGPSRRCLGCERGGGHRGGSLVGDAPARRERADDAGVEVELIDADARDLPHGLEPCDAVICLCEGAFCLVADDVEPLVRDRAILTSIYDVLRPDGRFVLTGLHAGRLLAAWHRGESTGDLDLLTLTETSVYELPDGGGIELREHYHLPDGLRTLAESVGFEVAAIWAGGALDWRREAPTVDDYELMLVARKPVWRRAGATRGLV